MSIMFMGLVRRFFILVTIISLLSLSLLGTSAFAQETTEPPDDAPTTNATVIANINIFDAEMGGRTEQNTIPIIFSIVNNGTVDQSDIRYGIEIMKNEAGTQIVVDSYVADETLTLAPNELVKKEILYNIPTFLSGDYEIWIISKTTSGLMLGLNRVGTTTFSSMDEHIELVPQSCILGIEGDEVQYDLYQGVDVGQNEELFFSCIVKNVSESTVSLIPVFNTYRRSIYGEKVETISSNTQTITLSPRATQKVNFTIPKATKPQSYDVSLMLVDSASERQLSSEIVGHYVLQGESATIQNFSLDKLSYAKDEMVTAQFMWTPSADQFPISRSGKGTEIPEVVITMEIKDGNGEACIDPYTQNVSGKENKLTIQTKTITLCATPNTTVTISDVSGTILDTRTFASSQEYTPSVESAVFDTFTSTRSNLAQIMLYVFTSLAALAVLYFVAERRKKDQDEAMKKKMSMPTTLLIFLLCIFGGFGVGVNKTEAITFLFWENNAVTGTSNTVVVNTNKTIYNTNENIVLSSAGTYLGCANKIFNYNVTFNLLGNTAQIATRIGSTNLIAPNSPGNYNINVTACVEQTRPVFPGAPPPYISDGWQCFSGVLPITVVAPPVNGSCGSANGATTATAPSSNLCSSGTASGVSGSGPWSWSCAGSGGGSTASCSANLIPKPNLISNSLNVSAGPYTVGDAIDLIGVARNIGTVGTGVGFVDEFTYQWGGTGGAWQPFAGNSFVKPILAANMNASNDSVPFVPTQSGTLYVRHCVDTGTVVDEGSMENDNCRVSTALAVNPAICTALPLNATYYGGGNTTGLLANTPGVFSAADTAAKCEFSCNVNYAWNGSVCALPNLTNITPTVAPGTYMRGLPVTLQGTVRNSGTVPTPRAFTDNFTYRFGATGGWNTFANNTVAKAILANGGTSNDSVTFTPLQAGSLYIQHCVDSTNVIAEGANETPNCSVSTSVTITNPNLTNTTPTLRSGSLTQGSVVTFQGTVAINSPVGETFNNVFRYRSNGGAWNTLNTLTHTNFTGNGTDVSSSFTLTAGDLEVEHCVDVPHPNGTVPESNETDNCKTTAVLKVKGATISAPDCGITPGNSTCESTITWNSSGLNPSSISIKKNGVEFDDEESSIGSPQTLTHGVTTFSVYDGATLVASDQANASCPPIAPWNNTICAGAPLPAPVLDLTADPQNNIPYNSDTVLTWTIDTNTTSCWATNNRGNSQWDGWQDHAPQPGENTKTITNLTQNTTFTLTCYAPDNTPSNVEDVTVTVLPQAATNQAPLVNAGGDRTIILPISSTQPSGASASDPDGTIQGTVWTQTGGTAVTISGGTTLTPTFSNFTIPGTYTFTLTATDDDGATTQDSMTVSVLPGGTPPPTGSLSLRASPRIVDEGADTTLTWNTGGAPESTCYLTGGAFGNGTNNILPIDNGGEFTGTIPTPVYANTTYTLTCPSLLPTTARVNVEIIPRYFPS